MRKAHTHSGARHMRSSPVCLGRGCQRKSDHAPHKSAERVTGCELRLRVCQATSFLQFFEATAASSREGADNLLPGCSTLSSPGSVCVVCCGGEALFFKLGWCYRRTSPKWSFCLAKPPSPYLHVSLDRSMRHDRFIQDSSVAHSRAGLQLAGPSRHDMFSSLCESIRGSLSKKKKT